MTAPPALPGPPSEVWNRLALAANNLFATRDWAETCWEHFGEGEPLVLTDDDADPSIVMALHRSGRLVRQWRMIGSGPADQLGPACAPEHRDKARELLRTFLDRDHGWDVTVLHDVATDEGWDLLPGASEVRRVPSPVLSLPSDDWETFLLGRSKSFREQLRRKRKKLEREAHPTLRLATPQTLAADLETFFSLHQLRWGDDAPLAHGAQREFQVAFARRAADHGWLRLWFLEVDGRAVATSLGYRFGDAEYFYQSGRDPAFEHLSVGAVMMGHAIQGAVESGAVEYRLLRGDEGYKARWADHDRAVQTVAVARSLRGRAAVQLAARRAAERARDAGVGPA